MPRTKKTKRSRLVPKLKKDTKRKVHITFNSHETSRIIEPIKEYQPDSIYYFTHIRDQNLEYRDQNLKQIKSLLPEIEIHEPVADYVNYFDVIGQLSQIINDERKDPNTEISINLGTGSKIVAIANTDAYRLWSKDTSVFYPYSDDYNPERKDGGPFHFENMKKAKFPDFQFITPSMEIIRALQVIYHQIKFDKFEHTDKDYVTRKDWEAEWPKKIQQIIESLKDPNKSEEEFNEQVKEIENKYSSEKILRELETTWNFIFLDTSQGGKRIKLTNKGKNFAGMIRNANYGFIFEPKIEDASEFQCTLDELFIVDEEFQPTRKVHIVFNVKEKERITDPILQDKPDKIYYFHFQNQKKDDIYPNKEEENITCIQSQLPNCQIEQISLNYVDYYDIMGKLAKIFSTEIKIDGTRIAIHLGTGSKMCAIASMDAYRLWPKHVIPFYIYSRDYDPKRESAMHEGPMEKSQVPLAVYKTPDEELIKGMQILFQSFEKDEQGKVKRFAYQSTWENNLKQCGLLVSKSTNEDARKRSQAEANLIRENFKKPLENWEFITEKKSGKEVIIKFTPLGEKIFQIFENYDYGLSCD
jgi:hypothetical protein